MRTSHGPALSLTLFTLVLSAGIVWPAGAGADILWALEKDGPNLRIIDPATGADLVTVSSTLTGQWRGIAIDPATGVLHATETELLFLIDKTTGAATPVGLFGDVLVRDLTFDHLGQLYGVTGSQGADAGSLHAIDAGTGLATFLVALGGAGGHGIAHDPQQPGTFYHLAQWAEGPGTFEQVDLATLTVTPIGLSGDPITGRSRGLEYDPVDGLFRVFDESGRYYAVERDGTVTAGAQNPTRYFGLAYDETFEQLIFSDGFESGDTTAWSQAVPRFR